jgi:hypothetical protein
VFRAASHDFTYLSYLTLRYYKRSDCPVPFYVITEDKVSQTLQNFSNVIVQMDFEDNWVSQFVRTPGYVIGVTIPAYTVSILLFGFSSVKLYHSGFPKIRNTGTALCLLGIFLSILMCKSRFLELTSPDLLHQLSQLRKVRIQDQPCRGLEWKC